MLKKLVFILLLKRLISDNRAWNREDCLAGVFFCLLILCVLSVNLVYGKEQKTDNVGIYQQLGQTVPLDLTFYDEAGSAVKLGSIINQPTILSLVYYQCHRICPQVLAGLAMAVSELNLIPDKDYKLITLSFDAKDDPQTAYQVKRNYITAINKPFPEEAWKFLTGNSENIEKITEALGFKYRKEMHGFIHPVVLVILSPNGKIIQYIYVSKYLYGVSYPITFPPIELKIALSNASQGNIYKTDEQTPLFCFPHKPSQENMFFTVLKISGIIMILILLIFITYLMATSKKVGE